jgi:hypothetical protein
VTARAIYAKPADAFWSGSISDFARERLCEIGDASGLKRSLPNGRGAVASHADDRHGNSSSLETMPYLDP